MSTGYVLRLANVRGNVDAFTWVAAFASLEEGRAWEQAQRAPAPYIKRARHFFSGQEDYPYELVYKEGSRLEWYNPPDDFGAGFCAVNLPDGREEEICSKYDIPFIRQ